MRLSMTRTLLFSVIGIAAIGTAIGAGTFAFFSGGATSTTNTFAAGTLTLDLGDNDESASQSVAATWTVTDFAPGDTVSGFLTLQNSGTAAGDHVDIEFTNSVTESVSLPGSDPTTPMDTVLKITFLCYDSNGDAVCTDPGEVDLLSVLVDGNANTILDLDDLENLDLEGTEDLVDLALTDTGADHRLDMTVEFDTVLGVNEHQDDQVVTVVDVFLNQDASQ